jgi:hypothetical protein
VPGLAGRGRQSSPAVQSDPGFTPISDAASPRRSLVARRATEWSAAGTRKHTRPSTWGWAQGGHERVAAPKILTDASGPRRRAGLHRCTAAVMADHRDHSETPHRERPASRPVRRERGLHAGPLAAPSEPLWDTTLSGRLRGSARVRRSSFSKVRRMGARRRTATDQPGFSS